MIAHCTCPNCHNLTTAHGPCSACCNLGCGEDPWRKWARESGNNAAWAEVEDIEAELGRGDYSDACEQCQGRGFDCNSLNERTTCDACKGTGKRRTR